MVNTCAMHIFQGPVRGSNLHDSLFFFLFIFKVTIIKTTSFWFYLKLNIKNPTHLFLIQPPSLCTSALSLSLSNTDFPTFTIFFLDFRGILVIFRFQGYFGHFLGFRGILVIFWVLGVFWLFFGFREYFCHFLGYGDILVIFRFQEYFDYFLGFGGILVIFCILVIFWVSEIFW